jgi:hypothetical protein
MHNYSQAHQLVTIFNSKFLSQFFLQRHSQLNAT